MQKLLLLCLLMLCLGALSAQNQNITFRSKLTFPNQTIANVSGYAADGREYALLGGSKGLIIAEVTNPDQPQQIVQIPGPDNFWKEIKTYSHYAYVTSEGGQGLQIVDLSDLPSADLNSHFYTGDGAIAGQLNTIHALHIDQTKGYLYIYGSNLFNGGAVVLDLNADPYNPTYVGKYDQLGYIHDGFVDNDTLYAGHIYFGIFAIVDMSDKSNPVVLGTQSTPNSFTHNTWPSDDRKYLFTTDETEDSYLAAYDISDPTSIEYLDKLQSIPGSNSIVHNTHVRGNYAITSWYSDGVSIVDITRPQNLVQTGRYDTYPSATGPGFIGCWGVYPYLPSGNLVASTISPAELVMLTPSYERASYLEGAVTEAGTGLPISGATVSILGNATAVEISGPDGSFRMGQVQSGEVQVQVTKTGFLPVTVTANLATAEITLLDVALEAAPSYVIAGNTLRAADGTPLPDVHVALVNDELTYETITDATGQFTVPGVFAGTYDVVAGKWGYRYKAFENHAISANEQLTFELERGYQDDFIFDYGWESGGTAQEGLWERGVPIPVNPGILLSPDGDVATDYGNTCYVTGNSSGEVDEDDLESGTGVLTSPEMDLTIYSDPRLTAMVWCTSFNTNNESLDSIKVYLDNGLEEKLVWVRPGQTPGWQLLSVEVTDVMELTSTMRLKVVGFDNPDYLEIDSYEAAFDRFRVNGALLVNTAEPDAAVHMVAMPNPFSGSTLIGFEGVGKDSRLLVYDLPGRLMQSLDLPAGSGQVSVGEGLPQGVYLARLEQEGRVVRTVRLVKQ